MPAVRLKDIAHVQGARDNQLLGYGIVVGLNGTGDTSEIVSDILGNFLERMDVTIDPDDLDAKNVAVVTVTADLPAFVRAGTRIDCLVSSLADAKSLQGGVLLQTPLYGADRRVYAVAQGAISTGGFSAGGAAASITKGHPTVGNIPNGALVEREVPVTLVAGSSLTVCLREPDFTTASRVAEAINRRFPKAARAVDGGTVRVAVPPETPEGEGMVAFIARLEEVAVQPDSPARVIINERTGTIVGGAQVRIAKVAIAHGSLVFITKESAGISQPAPLSDGETVVVPDTQLEVRETERRFVVIDPAPTVADVAKALNALGVKPNDIVAIFQAIKRAGALPAELIVM
ncbi:MAG: flagellar basal body P-ring protein FlgI [Candidatus Brocadiia bacterium]